MSRVLICPAVADLLGDTIKTVPHVCIDCTDRPQAPGRLGRCQCCDRRYRNRKENALPYVNWNDDPDNPDWQWYDQYIPPGGLPAEEPLPEADPAAVQANWHSHAANMIWRMQDPRYAPEYERESPPHDYLSPEQRKIT